MNIDVKNLPGEGGEVATPGLKFCELCRIYIYDNQLYILLQKVVYYQLHVS